MPRPTPAQFAYGSVTVICSTLAMLLLSGAPSGPAVAVIPVVALVLGVLVALKAPGSSRARAGARTDSSGATAHVAAPAAADATDSRHHTRHGAAAHGTAVRRARSTSARRVAEPSLRH